MDDRPPPPPRNPSRSVLVAVVAVLVVVAIAGIVLNGLRGRGGSPDAAPADATQASAAALTAAASAAAVEDEAGPNQVVFAPTSDRLSAAGTAKLEKLAATAKKENRGVVFSTRIDRADQLTLAKSRVDAARKVFVGKDIPLATMRVEVSTLPPGLVPAREADRVDVTLR